MDDKRKDVNREYLEKLLRQNYSFQPPQDAYGSYTLPLHEMLLQASEDSLEWISVNLLLSKLPPNMAKQALMWKDGDDEHCPLHMASACAPQSTLVRMLDLAPEAAFIQDCRGLLPLSYAISFQNTTAVELLTKAYPQGLLVKDNNKNDPIREIFYDEVMLFDAALIFKTLHSSIKGLLAGLSKDSHTDLERITAIISKQIFKFDHSTTILRASLFREIVNKFIEKYENGDDCNLCEMLLRLYCIASNTTEIFYLEPCLEIVFGEYLGGCTFSMSVEYRLLNIIERHETSRLLNY